MEADKKKQINNAMKAIAERKPGNSKFVYDRSRRRIVVVDQWGKYVRDAGITFHDSDET